MQGKERENSSEINEASIIGQVFGYIEREQGVDRKAINQNIMGRCEDMSGASGWKSKVLSAHPRCEGRLGVDGDCEERITDNPDRPY